MKGLLVGGPGHGTMAELDPDTPHVHYYRNEEEKAFGISTRYERRYLRGPNLDLAYFINVEDGTSTLDGEHYLVAHALGTYIVAAIPDSELAS